MLRLPVGAWMGYKPTALAAKINSFSSGGQTLQLSKNYPKGHNLVKVKEEGRINLLLGGALNDELERLTRRLLQDKGLITSKTDLIRSAVAIYVKALQAILDESKILTIADIQEMMLSRLDPKHRPPPASPQD